MPANMWEGSSPSCSSSTYMESRLWIRPSHKLTDLLWKVVIATSIISMQPSHKHCQCRKWLLVDNLLLVLLLIVKLQVAGYGKVYQSMTMHDKVTMCRPWPGRIWMSMSIIHIILSALLLCCPDVNWMWESWVNNHSTDTDKHKHYTTSIRIDATVSLDRQ